uniref:Uncharacterized protein n=1 Tax=viral metagenome TaxID=1070528 RepID=A0A6M3IVU5_9ZZZZ
MRILNDEEIVALCKKHQLVKAVAIAVAKAQHQQDLEDFIGELEVYAKAYEMRIDGFVVPWGKWQSLKDCDWSLR